MNLAYIVWITALFLTVFLLLGFLRLDTSAPFAESKFLVEYNKAGIFVFLAVRGFDICCSTSRVSLAFP